MVAMGFLNLTNGLKNFFFSAEVDNSFGQNQPRFITAKLLLITDLIKSLEVTGIKTAVCVNEYVGQGCMCVGFSDSW